MSKALPQGENMVAIKERIMRSGLDALVGLNKQLAAEEQLTEQGQDNDTAREIDDRDDPFDRRDFRALMISIAILVLAIGWVAPW